MMSVVTNKSILQLTRAAVYHIVLCSLKLEQLEQTFIKLKIMLWLGALHLKRFTYDAHIYYISIMNDTCF